MTSTLIDQFFEAYMLYANETRGQDAQWRYLPSTRGEKNYSALEQELGIVLPDSYKQWHGQYDFPKIEFPMLNLFGSNRNLSLLASEYDWDLPPLLAGNQLYIFGDEANDVGPLVFDGRDATPGNEFPIRVYDHEFIDGEPEALSEIIFSSFTKMVECLLHYIKASPESGHGTSIRQFYDIDPEGAGSQGREYWDTWMAMLDETD